VVVLSQIETRLKKFNWTLLEQEQLLGLHAGQLLRMTIFNENGQRVKIIYKEFAKERKNELEIYKNIPKSLEQLIPILKIIDEKPEAIILKDLGKSLKSSYHLKADEERKMLLDCILQKLVNIHTVDYSITLPTHHLSSEWFDWAKLQLRILKKLNVAWFQSEWLQVIEKAYYLFKLEDYQIRGVKTLTHGDPHLDNIFYNDEKIYFIDWEWATISSPVRDVTILLQDILDRPTTEYVKANYHRIIALYNQE
jgi:hypothetical protein